jgi:hypothetical protein
VKWPPILIQSNKLIPSRVEVRWFVGLPWNSTPTQCDPSTWAVQFENEVLQKIHPEQHSVAIRH